MSESAKRPSNFRELYDAWLNALSVQELNKKFYTELAHWYFWARIFSNCHPIYAMLFDLQALDVVRIIEARD